MSLQSVRAFRGSRTRGCCAAAASMSTTSCCRAWRSAMCCARRTPTPRSSSIDTAKAKAAPGVLCVLTGDDWIKSGWGDLPVPGTHKRRDGSTNYKPRYPALVKDRVRFVGDYVAFVVAETKNQAMDAGRTDRGRLRAAAGHRRHRRRRQARRDAGLGRLQGQHLLRRDPRRQGQDRGGLRQGRACRQGASRHQPRHHRVDGAARLGRRLQRHRRPATRSTPRCSARIPTAPSWPSSC